LGVRATYDHDDDLLSVVVGEPSAAITESIENGLYIRIDPDSEKIVGFEVYDIRSHIIAEPIYLNVILDLLSLVSLRPADSTAEAADAPKRFAASFRELVGV
ncbi:MAG: hypothetical protein ACYDCQ_20910, partial [Dehalococcoidia bacterium]